MMIMIMICVMVMNMTTDIKKIDFKYYKNIFIFINKT